MQGQSGELLGEKTWSDVKKACGATEDITERTTVTDKIRRIGSFDAALVKKAIQANAPNKIVLNHIDHLDWSVRKGTLNDKVVDEIEKIEVAIGRKIDLLGTCERDLILRPHAKGDIPKLRAVS